MHSIGIMYNDVKPQNLLFHQDGTLYFIDFECCRFCEKTYELGTWGKRLFILRF